MKSHGPATRRRPMLRKSLPSIFFLVLFVPPLAAIEESLVGTWEASGDDGYGAPFTTRLVFLEDGTFEFSSVRTEEYARLHAVFKEDAEVSVADVKTLIQLYREALPETPLDARSILGSGTYAAFWTASGWNGSLSISLRRDFRNSAGPSGSWRKAISPRRTAWPSSRNSRPFERPFDRRPGPASHSSRCGTPLPPSTSFRMTARSWSSKGHRSLRSPCCSRRRSRWPTAASMSPAPSHRPPGAA